MKISNLVPILLVFTLTVSLTNKEIIQQLLNGAFQQNKLPDPTTIVPCIDDKSAAQIVDFAGKILDKAAKGSVSDLISIIQLVKDFGNQLDPAVGQCLDGNAEFQALGLKYGIDNTTDSSVIQKKVIAYVTLHYLQVHKWCGDLDNDWHAGKYYNVGFQGALYGHSVLGQIDIIKHFKNLRSVQILNEKKVNEQILEKFMQTILDIITQN